MTKIMEGSNKKNCEPVSAITPPTTAPSPTQLGFDFDSRVQIFVAADLGRDGVCTSAWVNVAKGTRKTKRGSKARNETGAIASAISEALTQAPAHAELEIVTDSEVACANLDAEYEVQDENLARVLRRESPLPFEGFEPKDVDRFRALIRKKDLRVRFTLIATEANPAQVWLTAIMGAILRN